MDQRIADFISANRGKYTREAIRQQLIDTGYSPEAIDATWAILDTPDPDEAAVAGEGFWGRFFLFLIGLNVAVFLLVALSTGMLSAGQGGGFALAGVFGVALGIGALISWGIVAAVGPEKLGQTSATVIGGLVPILFALLIGGSCFALVGSIGPPPPPPRDGSIELEIDPPMGFTGSGAAFCQIQENGTGFSIYTPEGSVGSINGRPVHVSVDSFSDPSFPEGGPAPAPVAPGGESVPNLYMYIFLGPRSESDPPQEWFVSPDTQLDVDLAPDGLSGMVTFDGLEPARFDEEPAAPGNELDTISGTVSWSCEEEQ
jgi:hypothetical protein